MPEKILIVDDDSAKRLMLLRLLQSKVGWTLCQAEDGDAGLTAFREFRPSIVLLDVMMPPGDYGGFITCRQMRLLEKELSTRSRIVMITAAAMPEQAEEGMAAGADSYFTFPCDQAALFRAILGIPDGWTPGWSGAFQNAAA